MFRRVQAEENRAGCASVAVTAPLLERAVWTNGVVEQL